ncbi:MAG: hypothetical protein BEN19_07115 [Epulopiscium sp. Nuni2H_MBin003]|nr:MAG: hypothetical protein BEN19_07115 [Epulopiscium sp. Nuni2H_MBin003]
MKLDEARIKINEIDEQIVNLFEERMELVVDIAKYKQQNDMPIYQPEREKQVIEKNLAYIKNDSLKSYAKQMMLNYMELSKDYQAEQLNLKVTTPKLPSKKYALIGEKLGHSMSVNVHKAIFRLQKIEGVYDLYQVPQNKSTSVLEAMKTLDFDGLNVTIPYKEIVIPQLDFVDDIAIKIGAVNTIQIKDNKTYGYNTDYYGFGAMLAYNNVEVTGQEFYVLGAGGSAKSVLAYLKDKGAASVKLVTRDKTSAKRKFEDTEIIDYDEFDNISPSYAIINTTPLGMYPNEDAMPIKLEKIMYFKVAVDLIYNPVATQFLQIAKECGLKTINGLYMLVAQAVKAQEIWEGRKFEVETTNLIYENLDKICHMRTQSIYLLGFMGTGKTTIGKELAHLLGMKFIDTDAYIEETANMSIKEIFDTKGELYFRQLEQEALLKLNEPAIYATGGGILTYQENYDLLRTRKCIYLKNGIETLYERIKNDSNRPLVGTKAALKKRLINRKAAYETCCYIHIDQKNLSIHEVVNQILKELGIKYEYMYN